MDEYKWFDSLSVFLFHLLTDSINTQCVFSGNVDFCWEWQNRIKHAKLRVFYENMVDSWLAIIRQTQGFMIIGITLIFQTNDSWNHE